MGTLQDRVHPRYRVGLAGTMQWRKNTYAIRVYDVSLGGIFAFCDEQPPMRELVRLEFQLPERPEPFVVYGMPVNNARKADVEGYPQGVGVQFYAMDRELQRAWSKFVDLVRRGVVAQPAPDVPAVVPPPRSLAPPPLPVSIRPAIPPPASIRPAPAPARSVRPLGTSGAPGVASRYAAEFELEVQNIEELYLFYERDVTIGGMFIPTNLDLPIRARVRLDVRHPLTGETFELTAMVCQVDCGLDTPGVGVEFTDLDDDRRTALMEFVFVELGDSQGPAKPAAPGRSDENLAQLFDPWVSGDMRPWSKPPHDDELDMIFGALGAPEHTSMRLSQQPPMPADDAPDFRLSIPSWGVAGELPVAENDGETIDLSDDEILEVDEAEMQVPRYAPAALPQRRQMNG